MQDANDEIVKLMKIKRAELEIVAMLHFIPVRKEEAIPPSKFHPFSYEDLEEVRRRYLQQNLDADREILESALMQFSLEYVVPLS